MGRKKKVDTEEKVVINDMELCECENNRSHHAVYSSAEYRMLSNKYNHLDNNDLAIMKIDCFFFRSESYKVLEETEFCKIVTYNTSKKLSEEPKNIVMKRRSKKDKKD